MIDPEFWSDEEIGKWSFQARLFYIGLWNFADDEGRFKAHSALLKAQIFPYERKINIDRVKKEISTKIQWYEINKSQYGHIRNFLKYQRIDRPTPSKLPPPLDDSSTIPRGNVLPNIREVNISKENIYVEVAETTFDSYIKTFSKNKAQYQFTTKRKNKLQQRARELHLVTQDVEKTKELMFLAIKNRKASTFHMGDNPQGKKYIDIVDHIFRSQEYTEQLIFEEKPKYTDKRAEWMDDLAKKYEERAKRKTGEGS